MDRDIRALDTEEDTEENTVIEIHTDVLAQVYAHGEETYPEECCGVLIAAQNKPRQVVAIKKMKNVHPGPRTSRYSIDPLDLMELEDELDERDLVMVGIYHSHPDHPDEPSSFDVEYAWPKLSYFVMRTTNAGTESLRSWIFDPTARRFYKEKLIILPK